jgi:hypothetical protein
MTAIISANRLATRDNRPPAPVSRDDGTAYPWRMFYDNNRLVADFDNPEDALEILSPGYISLTPEERLVDRIQLAQNVRVNARAVILTNLSEKTVDSLQPWEKDVLFVDDDPFGWGVGHGTLGEHDPESEQADIWSSSAPLVLLTTSYQPSTEIPRPMSSEGDYENVSNIIWLRPEYELDFLRSLSQIGFIAFGAPQAATFPTI